MNALIVEENPTISDLLTRFIEELTEYRFMKAPSKDAGNKLLEGFQFKLVIIDFHTSHMFLDDILKNISGHPKIIILTSYSNREDLENHYKLKVISKPFDLNDIVEKIKKDR